MGVDPVTLGLIATAVGGGLAARNQYQVAKQQDQTAAAGIRQQSARQRDIDARVNEEVQAVGRSNPDEARSKATTDFLSSLRRNRGQMSGPKLGAGSVRFDADSNALGGQVQDFGTNLAGNFAAINAPGIQRQQEGQGFSQLAADIGAQARAAGGDDFLNQLRQRGIRGNTGMEIAGGLLSGAGSGLAMRQPWTRQVVPRGTRVDVSANPIATRGLT